MSAAARRDLENKAYAKAMQVVLPKHLRDRQVVKLYQHEFRDPVKTEDDLDNRGGVANVSKQKLLEVVARIGETMEPTAVLTTQHPAELGLKGANIQEVNIKIQVPTE